MAVLIGLFIANLTAFKVSYRRYSSCALTPGIFCTQNLSTWEVRGVPDYLSRVRYPLANPNELATTGYVIDTGRYVRAVGIWSLVVVGVFGLSELEKRMREKKAKP